MREYQFSQRLIVFFDTPDAFEPRRPASQKKRTAFFPEFRLRQRGMAYFPDGGRRQERRVADVPHAGERLRIIVGSAPEQVFRAHEYNEQRARNAGEQNDLYQFLPLRIWRCHI